MKNLKIVSLIFFLVICISGTQKNKNSKNKIDVSKPNIIIILLDDAGYADFGFMGSKDLETPNIDNLAKNGVVFSDAHASASVCAPARAGLLSGIYQQRFGFESNHTGDKISGDIGLGDNIVTMADVFQKNKYKTIALGKWHLGKTEDDHPNKRGFDEFYGFLDGARSYFPIETPTKTRMLQQNGKHVKFDGYLTDVLTDRALGFVEENKEKPFFMYLSYNAVHAPFEAKKEDLKKFKEHPRQMLAAMTWNVDENIGRLTNKMKSLGLLQNSIVYFLVDNGGVYSNNVSNGPLKGHKGGKFEGGLRVPFIIHYPSMLKGIHKFDGLTSSLDIFATSIAAAGIKETEALQLDGVNLIPYLKDEKQGNPHDKLFWRKLNEAAARIGDYKLIRLKDYGANLYNLNLDLGEQNNLAKTDEKLFKELKLELETWEKEMMPPLWEESQEWQEVVYSTHMQLMQNKPQLYRNPKDLKASKKKSKNKY
jgi:arylsulfatase A-like enzyme